MPERAQRTHQETEQEKLLAEAKAELKRREHRDDKQRQAEDVFIETDRREQMMRDAHAHELRQPRETWDNAYDPDER